MCVCICVYVSTHISNININIYFKYKGFYHLNEYQRKTLVDLFDLLQYKLDNSQSLVDPVTPQLSRSKISLSFSPCFPSIPLSSFYSIV